jgi:hypothetical protein
MNLEWHVVSLFLASVTGWTLAAYGALPLSTLRASGRQVLTGVAGWIVVAVLAPSQIFHWYLIFAVLCLVAWTKLNRPAGKIWLALSAALGLTLGVIFPLEITPQLGARENSSLLALLYVNGATTGFAYVVCLNCTRGPAEGGRAGALALALVSFSIAGFGMSIWRLRSPGVSIPQGLASLATPCLLSGVIVGLAILALAALRRHSLPKARMWSGAAAVLAFVNGLTAQLVLR